MKALTHGQFEDAVDDLIVAVQIDRGHETDRDYLLAAYDAQAARIAELEAALRAVLPWLLHEIEYPGDPVEKVANGVRALLSKEA